MPSTLSAMARLLSTGGDRKTDPADALHVAQVALFRTDLRKVTAEDQSTTLRLLTERHNDLVNERTRTTNRLHAVLRDLLPGGAPTRLSADKAATLMKGIRPLTATDNCRRDIARDLLADLRRLDRPVKDNEAQMRDALAASRTSLTSLPGLGWPRRSWATSATSVASRPSTTSPATWAARPWTPPAERTSAIISTPAATGP